MPDDRLKSVFGYLLKSVLPVIAGLSILGLLIAWLAGAFTSRIEPGRQKVVTRRLESGQSTDVVHEVTKDYIEEAVGTLKAAGRAEISSRVLARIEEVTTSAGDLVDPGDLLIRLDDGELQARVRQAEQAVISAEASRRQAGTDFDRIKGLYDQNVSTKSSLDDAKARLDVTTADEQRSRQALEEAKIILSYATITAPRAGRVVDRLAEPGDTARPGEALLVIYDAASLRLEAPVLEKLAVQLRPGDTLTVRIDAVDRDVEATIDEIVPQADAPSRSFLVKATLPRTGDLYEGMFGRLLIPAGQRRHLCLDTAAIQEIGQLQFVEVVRDDQTLDRRMIRVGRLGMPGRVEVLSGLQAGERVVLREKPVVVPTESVEVIR
ncbi:MAG: efflux RND transporter periplasmic adaptor subunit [Rhodopirellula sp.]|nr:efflux RND transporter periplasmic adaptor subunit [Rhodopirellula sp.]